LQNLQQFKASLFFGELLHTQVRARPLEHTQNG
jgi:hypothetical protein